MSAPPIKVLVIDDEPPIRKLLRMGLGTQGYHIIDTPNAKAALDLMAEEPDFEIRAPNKRELALVIRALRYAKGWTQETFAELAGHT